MIPNSDDSDCRVQRLRSFQIDRSGSRRPGVTIRLLVTASLLCLTLSLAFVFVPFGERSDEATGTIASSNDAGSAKSAPLSQRFDEAAEPTALAAKASQENSTQSERSDWIIGGYLVPRRQSSVSPEVTAKMTELMVTEGMAVQRGQVIAHLDGTLAKADQRIAKARADAAARSVDVIQAELNEAKRVLERTRELSARRISSASELSKVETRVATFTAQLKEAQAKLEMAVREAERAAVVVDKYAVTAPFTGAVTACTAQVGETISPTSSGESIRNGVCTIVDTASIEIEIDVPETMISRVRLGAKANAFLDAYPKDALKATVRAIAPTANREKSTIKVRLGFDQMDSRLRPNMAVKVHLQESATELADG